MGEKGFFVAKTSLLKPVLGGELIERLTDYPELGVVVAKANGYDSEKGLYVQCRSTPMTVYVAGPDAPKELTVFVNKKYTDISLTSPFYRTVEIEKKDALRSLEFLYGLLPSLLQEFIEPDKWCSWEDSNLH